MVVSSLSYQRPSQQIWLQGDYDFLRCRLCCSRFYSPHPNQATNPLSRYDFAAPGRRKHKTDWSVLRTLPMFMGVMTILFTSLGNFIPSLWLPCMFIMWPLNLPTDAHQPMRTTSISMTPTVLLLSPYLTVPPYPVTPFSAISLIAFLFVLLSHSLVWVVLLPAHSCGVSGRTQGC